MKFFTLIAFLPLGCFRVLRTEHHNRNVMKYKASKTLRKLNPMNSPSSPPVPAVDILSRFECY